MKVNTESAVQFLFQPGPTMICTPWNPRSISKSIPLCGLVWVSKSERPDFQHALPVPCYLSKITWNLSSMLSLNCHFEFFHVIFQRLQFKDNMELKYWYTSFYRSCSLDSQSLRASSTRTRFLRLGIKVIFSRQHNHIHNSFLFRQQFVMISS
jgi:hypothetical protein